MKPCPRCESDDLAIVRGGIQVGTKDIILLYAVACDCCDLRGPASQTEESAVYLWNQLSRKQDGALEEIKRRLAYLEAAVAKSARRKR